MIFKLTVALRRAAVFPDMMDFSQKASNYCGNKHENYSHKVNIILT